MFVMFTRSIERRSHATLPHHRESPPGEIPVDARHADQSQETGTFAGVSILNNKLILIIYI